MQVITVIGIAYTGVARLAETLASEAGYAVLDDRAVIGMTSEKFGIDRRDLERSLYCPAHSMKGSVRKKTRAVAAMQLVLAENLTREKYVYTGYLGHLVPENVSTRILVVRGMRGRVRNLSTKCAEAQKDVLLRIDREDRCLHAWSRYLLKRGLCDGSPYDLVVKPDLLERDEIVRRIHEARAEKFSQVGDRVGTAMNDFLLSSQVGFGMAQEGVDVTASAQCGVVTLTIHRKCLVLNRLKRRIRKIAAGFPGVGEVRIGVGKGYHRADICHGYEFTLPEDRKDTAFRDVFSIFQHTDLALSAFGAEGGRGARS